MPQILCVAVLNGQQLHLAGQLRRNQERVLEFQSRCIESLYIESVFLIQGIAIGNGEFSSQRQSNSIILWSFYHGRISLKYGKTRAKQISKEIYQKPEKNYSKITIT